VRMKTKTRSESVSDAVWLGEVLRKADAPVPTSAALVPLSSSKSLEVGDGSRSSILAPPKLRKRAERIMTLAEAKKTSVFPVAIAPLFAGWRLRTKGSAYDYVFCNLAEDPLFSDPDGFPIPKRVLQDLKHLNATGLAGHFDVLYVVHEVDKGSIREGERLTSDKLVPPSPRVARASEQLGSLGALLWLGASIPLIASAGLGVFMAGVAGVVGAAALGVDVFSPLGLDPILLGAIVSPGRPVHAGDMAIWFYLAHWRYTDERR